jgi:hypothetical protein
MNTFEQFMDDKGYDYGSFDRCSEMDTIINEYGEYCATIVQESLSGSEQSSSPKYQCSNCLEHYFYITESGLCQGCFDAETQNEH